MENTKLVGLIKEAAKKTRQQIADGQPLVNYQPPGIPIIINPIIDTNNVSDGEKPPELKT